MKAPSVCLSALVAAVALVAAISCAHAADTARGELEMLHLDARMQQNIAALDQPSEGLRKARLELNTRVGEYRELRRQAHESHRHKITLTQQRDALRSQRDAHKQQYLAARKKHTHAQGKLKDAENQLTAYENGSTKAHLSTLKSQIVPLKALKPGKEQERTRIAKSLPAVQSGFPDRAKPESYTRLSQLKTENDAWFKQLSDLQQQLNSTANEYHGKIKILRNAVQDANIALKDAHAHVSTFKAALDGAQSKLDVANAQLHSAQLKHKTLLGRVESSKESVQHAARLVKQHLESRVRAYSDVVKDAQHLENKRLVHLKHREHRLHKLKLKVKELRACAERLTASIDKIKRLIAHPTAILDLEAKLKKAQNSHATTSNLLSQAKAELVTFTNSMNSSTPLPPSHGDNDF